MKRYTLTRLLPLAALALLQGCASERAPKVDDFTATPPDQVPIEAVANGAIYQENHDQQLFDNSVARRVGDVLTITLAESTNATKSAVTTTKKSTTAALPGVSIGGNLVTLHGNNLLSGSLNDASAFDGEGNSSQSNALTGFITVTVAKRLANGNLLVRGQKWIMINQGREFIRLQGIVRQVDISPDNTVQSYQVADANISYGGQGTLADANAKSWLARFFDSPWLPF